MLVEVDPSDPTLGTLIVGLVGIEIAPRQANSANEPLPYLYHVAFTREGRSRSSEAQEKF
jgi:hypothetical protein